MKYRSMCYSQGVEKFPIITDEKLAVYSVDTRQLSHISSKHNSNTTNSDFGELLQNDMC